LHIPWESQFAFNFISPFSRPAHGRNAFLIRRVSTLIFLRTRILVESSRRCCRRWRDKSSLSLFGSLSQADTGELTGRTVAIKSPERIRTPHATTVPMVALCRPRPGRMAGGNKRTRERCARGGWGTSIVDNPGMWCTRRIPCIGVVRSWKKKRKPRKEETAAADAARMLRPYAEGNIYERGWVLRVSATERNCTSWDTLIYWVITDLGARRARRARGVWLSRPRASPSRSRKMAEKNVLVHSNYIFSMNVITIWECKRAIRVLKAY